MKNLKIFTNNIEDSAKAQIDLLLEQEAFEVVLEFMNELKEGNKNENLEKND